MKELVGKRAIVTGRSSGIGQAIAVRLGEEGVDVAINYVGRPEGAEATKDSDPARRRAVREAAHRRRHQPDSRRGRRLPAST